LRRPYGYRHYGYGGIRLWSRPPPCPRSLRQALVLRRHRTEPGREQSGVHVALLILPRLATGGFCRLACHHRLPAVRVISTLPQFPLHGVPTFSRPEIVSIEESRSISGCWDTANPPIGRSSAAIVAITEAKAIARSGIANVLFDPAMPA